MSTLEMPWAALDAPTTWYRLPSVKAALAVSVLLHAAAIVLLPNLRVPEPKMPETLTVQLVPPPPPPKVAEAPPPAPPPLVKAKPKVTAPPPVPQVKPEPRPEPPPIAEARVPPPPQPIVVPRQPSQPEPQVTAPPRAEPPPIRTEPPAQVQAPPPPPAAVAPAQPVQAPALDYAVLREYGAVVSSSVAKRKVYPRLALMRRWQGTAELKLQITADGNLKALSVAHSSGFDILDDQAVRMVKDSMPLPTLPDALRGREFALDIPVAFKLQD